MRRGEEEAVDALLKLVFPGSQEADLVHKLRKGRVMAGENVLGHEDRIIGYFALSRMIAPKGWLCLAPMAIHPDWQGKRHGQRMMGLLTEWARISRHYVVVLGPVAFYQSGGFSQARAARLVSPYPGENTLLTGPGTDAPQKTLKYPKAFVGV